MRGLWLEMVGDRVEEVREAIGQAIGAQYERIAEALEGGHGYVIHGNVDRPSLLVEVLPDGYEYVHGQTREIDGARFGFVGGGAATPLQAEGELTDEAMTELLAGLGEVDVLCTHVAPAIDQAAYWARHNGCGEPVRAETPASSKTEWTSCRSGAPVVFHSVKGNGHAWPGGQPGREGAAEPTRAFDATAEMWAFFKQHRRTVGQR